MLGNDTWTHIRKMIRGFQPSPTKTEVGKVIDYVVDAVQAAQTRA